MVLCSLNKWGELSIYAHARELRMRPLAFLKDNGHSEEPRAPKWMCFDNLSTVHKSLSLVSETDCSLIKCYLFETSPDVGVQGSLLIWVLICG